MAHCRLPVSAAASGPLGAVFTECHAAFVKNCAPETNCDGLPWKELPTWDSGRIRIFSSHVEGKTIKRFKAVCTFDAPPAVVSKYCFDKAVRMTWDFSLGSADVKRTYSEGLHVMRFTTVKMFGISQREFVNYHWHVHQPDDGSFLSVGRFLRPEEAARESDEVGEDLCTVPKGFTRGQNHPGGGRMFSPGPTPGTTVFTNIVTSDIKGWLPKALINRSIPKTMATVFLQLRRALAAADLPAATTGGAAKADATGQATEEASEDEQGGPGGDTASAADAQ